MVCINDEDHCYNSGNLPDVDYKCTAENPICVKADGSEPALQNPGDKCVDLPWYTYSTNADFHNNNRNNTVLFNVDTHTADQLDLKSSGITFKFVWVPESNLGTVVKIDTDTSVVVGHYKTWPDSNGLRRGEPSGLSVDLDGSVWIANFNNNHNGNGTITHIGLEENGQCKDWNGNGKIDTSTSFHDFKAWADDTGTHGVVTADDECIVHFLVVTSSGMQHVTVSQANDVWVSGSSAPNFDLVKGGCYDVAGSGTVTLTFASVGWGGVGGLIDGNGVVWSSNYAKGLLRWDPRKQPLGGINRKPGQLTSLDVSPPVSGTTWAGNKDLWSWGLCFNSSGFIWNALSLLNGEIRKYASNGQHMNTFGTGGTAPKGCVIDHTKTDDVWIANSGSNTVSHLHNNGTLVGTVHVGYSPFGVAVDRLGKIWVCHDVSSNVMCIDPTLNN